VNGVIYDADGVPTRCCTRCGADADLHLAGRWSGLVLLGFDGEAMHVRPCEAAVQQRGVS